MPCLTWKPRYLLWPTCSKKFLPDASHFILSTMMSLWQERLSSEWRSRTLFCPTYMSTMELCESVNYQVHNFYLLHLFLISPISKGLASIRFLGQKHRMLDAKETSTRSSTYYDKVSKKTYLVVPCAYVNHQIEKTLPTACHLELSLRKRPFLDLSL